MCPIQFNSQDLSLGDLSCRRSVEALVKMITCVTANMKREIIRLGKRTIAEMAFVWLYTGVDSIGLNENFGGCVKGFAVKFETQP